MQVKALFCCGQKREDSVERRTLGGKGGCGLNGWRGQATERKK